VLNHLRATLPLLLALSANSPFVAGRDGGLASARTVIFQAFPRTGAPRRFAGYSDYVHAVDALIAPGALPDPSFLWWDLRLRPTLGTVEVRVMDAQPWWPTVSP
jgi:glutamate---cysteine ligase / carboxylate-amine ligase